MLSGQNKQLKSRGVSFKQSAGAQRRQRWNAVTTTRRANVMSNKYGGIIKQSKRWGVSQNSLKVYSSELASNLDKITYSYVMQKFLSFLIVFIISVFPIVNASASLSSSCEHMMDESMSMSQPMSNESMVDMDNASNISSANDCCETHKLPCDNSNACDNSQVNYSAVPSIQIAQPQDLGSFKPRYISSHFHSKSSDSLYRPPIDILI